MILEFKSVDNIKKEEKFLIVFHDCMFFAQPNTSSIISLLHLVIVAIKFVLSVSNTGNYVCSIHFNVKQMVRCARFNTQASLKCLALH